MTDAGLALGYGYPLGEYPRPSDGDGELVLAALDVTGAAVHVERQPYSYEEPWSGSRGTPNPHVRRMRVYPAA